MSLPEIREQIKAILQSVPGIGVVHDYERWTADQSAFAKRFKDADGRINGCQFAREKWQEQQTTAGETEVAHTLLFRRIMGIKDDQATGITFDDNLDAMRGAFRNNKTLNETCRTIDPDWGEMEGAVGLQGNIIEPRMFGGVLCHYAECRLCVIEAQEN